MDEAKLAWIARSVMVVVAAVVAYLLVQTEVPLEPTFRVVLGAIAVGLAALSPTTVANQIATRITPPDGGNG